MTEIEDTKGGRISLQNDGSFLPDYTLVFPLPRLQKFLHSPSREQQLRQNTVLTFLQNEYTIRRITFCTPYAKKWTLKQSKQKIQVFGDMTKVTAVSEELLSLIFRPRNGGIKLIRNVGKHLLIDTLSFSWRSDASYMLPWETKWQTNKNVE